MKRYKLLKDLPFAKAGEIFKEMHDDGAIVLAPENWDQHRQEIYINEIENLDKWFEEIGEPEWVYYINAFGGDVDSVEVVNLPGVRANLKSTGNYFETKEEAEKYLKYIKAKAVIKESANEFKPDWNDHDQRKFYGTWAVEHKRPCLCSDDELQYRTIYFKTGEALLKSFDNHPDEWKTYLTYE